jgi:hypothetical protein
MGGSSSETKKRRNFGLVSGPEIFVVEVPISDRRCEAQPEKFPWPGSSREILPDLSVVNKGEKVGNNV